MDFLALREVRRKGSFKIGKIVAESDKFNRQGSGVKRTDPCAVPISD